MAGKFSKIVAAVVLTATSMVGIATVAPAAPAGAGSIGRSSSYGCTQHEARQLRNQAVLYFYAALKYPNGSQARNYYAGMSRFASWRAAQVERCLARGVDANLAQRLRY